MKTSPFEGEDPLSLSHEKRAESVLRHREWQSTLAKDAFFEEAFGEDCPPKRCHDFSSQG